MAGFVSWSQKSPEYQFDNPGIASRSGELETYALSSRAAARGSIPTSGLVKNTLTRVFLGARSRDRTDDLRFTKPLLYQLSYSGVFSLNSYFVEIDFLYSATS